MIRIEGAALAALAQKMKRKKIRSESMTLLDPLRTPESDTSTALGYPRRRIL
jgi:hypothetical protein